MHTAPLRALHSVQAQLPEGQSACAPALSILKPSNEFSRKSPGSIDAHVVVNDPCAASVEGQFLRGSALPGQTRVMFAYVLGGDVVFTQGRRQSLPSLWQTPG